MLDYLNRVLANKTLYITLFYIALVSIDLSIGRIYNLLIINLELDLMVHVFFFVVLTSAVFTWLILFIMRNKIPLMRNFESVFLNRTVWILQLIIFCFTLTLIFQILLFGKYELWLSTIVQVAGLLGSATLMTMLVIVFIKSYRLNRNYLVLSYTISSLFVTVHYVLSSAFAILLLHLKPTSVSDTSILYSHVFLRPGTAEDILNQMLSYTYYCSFITFWISTVLLLRYRSRESGTGAFFLIIFSPLLFFLSQFLSRTDLPDTIIRVDPVVVGSILTILFSTSPIVGGILFGLSFYITAKNIHKNNKLKISMAMAGHGFIILLLSNQYNVLLHFPYPPFGLITLSSAFLGSYMLLIGIYSSAVTSAQKMKIHDDVSRIIKKNSKLFREMSTSILMQEIRNEVIKVNQQMTTVNDVTNELTPDETHDLVEKILNELKRSRANI